MSKPSVALLYPGDRAMRDRSDPAESRFAPLFEAFARAGLQAVPAIYHDDFAGEVEAQLRECRVVLVWFNPIHEGRRRDRLDAMLRRVADVGVVVSAHPEAILKLGTKDVLFDTRDLPFGSDVRRVESLRQLEAELPERLRGGPRVLKQYRGHSGIGVWRVEAADAAAAKGMLRVRHAQRGSEEEVMDLPALLEHLAPYFEGAGGGHMIDQPWQPRIVEGMVRAYLVEDRVAGFGHQAVNALYPAAAGQPAPQPGSRLYHGPDLAPFQDLKACLESEWVEMLAARVGLERDRWPLLWDCDFMLGGGASAAAGRYVLCEINVSSVAPFPPSAIAPLVSAVQARLDRGEGRGHALPTPATRIAFVCLHGSAKSVLASEYLNRVARERGMDVSATASGREPDEEIPADVVEGLRAKGYDVRGRKPVAATAQRFSEAEVVVSFGCDLGGLVPGTRAIELWSACPAVSDDFEAAWRFITRRVDRLLASTCAEAPATFPGPLRTIPGWS